MGGGGGLGCGLGPECVSESSRGSSISSHINCFDSKVVDNLKRLSFQLTSSEVNICLHMIEFCNLCMG